MSERDKQAAESRSDAGLTQNTDQAFAHETGFHARALRYLRESDRFRKALEKINALGIYCCDDEGLGCECPAVLIALEALRGEEHE